MAITINDALLAAQARREGKNLLVTLYMPNDESYSLIWSYDEWTITTHRDANGSREWACGYEETAAMTRKLLPNLLEVKVDRADYTAFAWCDTYGINIEIRCY